jgi:hypothetical protein
MLVKNKETNFVMHHHTIGDIDEYQLSIDTGDGLQFLNLSGQAKMATISNAPKVTRLFGRESEDTRSEAWLTYEGTTKNAEGMDTVDGKNIPVPGVYEIFDSGKAIIGNQTEDYTEVFLNGSKMSDRWILRKIPNILEKVFNGEDPIYLLWKPPVQKSFNQALDDSVSYNTIECDCGLQDSSAKFHELVKEDGSNMQSEMVTDVFFNPENKRFEGIGAAEGTWIDMFGNKYTYTKEFITHNYNEQLSRLQSGEQIPLNTSHELEHQFEGQIDRVELIRDPIFHIKVSGSYNGPAEIEDDQFGLSYEYLLRSVWNEEFQSWVPFSAKTEKLSVVKRPACKICWINKVQR